MFNVRKSRFSYRKGQIVIEYILLLVCVVAVAFAILNLVDLGDKNTGQSGGAAIQYWRGVVEKIGSDL